VKRVHLRKAEEPIDWFADKMQGFRGGDSGAGRVQDDVASGGCLSRALDVLHVAAAVILKAKGVLTFDKHQRELAKVEGLEVAP
jgi:hypothetical protein